MVTNLFLKELGQNLVKPPCARIFATPINFVVNAYEVPRVLRGTPLQGVSHGWRGRRCERGHRGLKAGTKGQRYKGQEQAEAPRQFMGVYAERLKRLRKISLDWSGKCPSGAKARRFYWA